MRGDAMKNMTQGNVMKLLLSFAVPVLLGNIFQQFYTMADTMMVGQILGVRALAAMGATASLSGLVIGLVSGVSMGVSILIAQYYGARDQEGMKMATYVQCGNYRACRDAFKDTNSFLTSDTEKYSFDGRWVFNYHIYGIVYYYGI